MTAPFEMTPARRARWLELKARGFKDYEVARDLGCSPCTLIRWKRRTGKINAAKQRAGRLGMASRYGHEVHHDRLR